ncbi:MAG: chloride channel protein [Porticoccaceae bacterium]|nr:MAG: chloride channel protein [Porticoccaceae bacterium]
MPKETLLSASTWRTRLVLWSGGLLVGAASCALAVAAERAEALRDALFAAHPWAPLLVLPAGLALAVWLTRRFAPAARGSGIPQAIAALGNPDETYRRRLLSLPVAAWKFVLTVWGMACGASIGREGPTVHIGAAILFQLGRAARLPHHLLERGLILAGGAAGIAAAFNTPLAGIMFAIEELARSFEERSSGAVITAVVLAGVVALAVLGNYTYFGRTEVTLPLSASWLAIPLCGVVGGLLGGLFSRALVTGSRCLVPIIRRRPLGFAAAVGLALAVLGIASDGASFGSGYHHARDVVTGAADAGFAFTATKIVATWLSYFTGIPGGIFAPSLAAGAGLGGELARLAPAAPADAVVILGMVAYFSGVVQTPITATVIVLEMTANPQMALPILATAFLAFATSRLILRQSVYWALAEDLLEREEERRARAAPQPPLPLEEPQPIGEPPRF